MKIQILGSINQDGEKVYSILYKKFLFKWKLFDLVKLYSGGRISDKPFYYPNPTIANLAVQICHENKLLLNNVVINTFIRDGLVCSTSSLPFYKKVEVLRKLTNIRNYFGGDKPTNMWTLTRDSALRVFPVLCPYKETCHIYFDTREHAEQAIQMLGDELKYLFEPW